MKILYQPDCYSQQRQFQKKRKIYPVLMAMEAEYYRQKGHKVDWDVEYHKHDKVIHKPEGLPFLELPPPDREFTRWWEYQDNGNFKHLPATYILSANGCWHGKCSFCVEKHKKYQVRPVDDVIAELYGIKSMGFREVFDDSATFPTGEWLWEFCDKFRMIDLKLSCNMRFGYLCSSDYIRLKKAGFRMLLYGLESASQKTLNMINKGIDIKGVVEELKMASRYGLEPHIAVMFGYPFEADEDSKNTLKLVHYLLRKGYAKTAQASFYDTKDRSNENHRKYVKKIYDVVYYPEFWFNKLRELRSVDDIKYLWKSIKEGVNAK